MHCCHGHVQQLSEEYASCDMISLFIINIYIRAIILLSSFIKRIVKKHRPLTEVNI
jgi:hypothetical protein